MIARLRAGVALLLTLVALISQPVAAQTDIVARGLAAQARSDIASLPTSRGVSADQKKPRIVGTNGRLRTTVLATSATHTVMEVEHFFYVGNDTSWLSFAFDNWYTTNSGGLGTPPTPLTVVKAGVMNASATRWRPIRFDGSRTVDIAAGGSLFSDRVHALEFGLPVFKRGTKLYVKLRLSVPATTGQFLTGGTQFNPTNTYASRFDPTVSTNVTDQVDTLTHVTAKTGQSDYAAGYMFTAVIGEGDPRIPPLINADGDSIGQSANDSAGYALESGSALLRLSMTAAQTMPVPMLNMARGSSAVSGAIASMANRQPYFAFAAGGIAISQGGTGDIGPSGNGDIEALKTNLLASWAALRAAGVSKIIRLGILPRNTSTDGYTTLAGQVRVPAFDTKMLAMNAWFEEQLAAGVIDAYVPLNSLRDPGDPTLWRTSATANYYVADGTHPESPGHVLIHAEVRPVIERMYAQIALAALHRPARGPLASRWPMRLSKAHIGAIRHARRNAPMKLAA